MGKELKQMKRLLAYSLLIVLLVMASMKFLIQTTENIILNQASDVRLVRDEVKNYFNVNLSDSDIILVMSYEDLGEPFNHQAVDFVYLDAFLKKSTKTKLIIDKIRAQTQATNAAGIYSSYAASFTTLCSYLDINKVRTSNACNSDGLLFEQSEVGDESNFGYFVVVEEPNSSGLLLRRFWALDTDF